MIIDNLYSTPEVICVKKYIKRFKDWFEIKQYRDNAHYKPPLVEEGNVWWCRLGENIGVEISGKGKEFIRPVIVHTKFTSTSYLVVPMTTKLTYKNGKTKEGTWFVPFRHQGINNLACLSQIRVVDYRRLHNYKGKLDDADFSRVCSAVVELLDKK